MKVGIMQPYFFPYIGYLALIKQVDRFILLDHVQFIRHGWIERNRILKSSGGWSYISVPLEKHSRDTLISNIKIRHEEKWKEKILSQLTYYKGAPYYYAVKQLLETCFQEDFHDIVSCNFITLQAICKYLKIDTPIEIFSQMNLKIDIPQSADEWALNICKALPNVTEYWNPEGGTNFFNRDKYISENIQIHFLKIHLKKYKQKSDDFEPGLSILDVMMYNSPEDINAMLDDFELI